MLEQQHLPEILLFLQTRQYIEVKEGTYVFTHKFFVDTETVRQQRGLPTVVTADSLLLNLPILTPNIIPALASYNPPPPASVLQSPQVFHKNADWQGLFIELIMKAEVPKMGEDTRGNLYALNKYSDAGMKAMRKAVEKDGVHFPALVQSTKLYYKSKVRLKKAVGNYFAQGDWLSDYEALKASMIEGKDSVVSHIKEQTDGGQRSNYKLG